MIKKLFDTYPGGKEGTGVPQNLINQIPPHEVYIEGFLGNGTILRYKKPANINIGIELNSTVAGKWMDLNPPGVGIIKGCFFEFVQSERFLRELNNRRTYLFLDPPYIINSRLQQKSLYENELTDLDHQKLLEIITQLDCNIGITHYSDPMYLRALSTWRRHEFTSQTRGGCVHEIMFCNYPTPKALHDYQYLGADYRERERIKRKVNRWVGGLDRMPDNERLAITTAINDRIHSKENT